MSGHRAREDLTYENASLLRARNTVKDAKKPVFKPIVWQVDAKDRFSGDKRVKAQPSTAMSIAKGRINNRNRSQWAKIHALCCGEEDKRGKYKRKFMYVVCRLT